MSVFARLGFDFDSEKFGAAGYLPEETINTLKITSQSDLYTWQKDRLELNTPIEITEYRQNPFGNICNSILDQVQSIVTRTESPPADWGTWVSGSANPPLLLAAAEDLVIQVEEFKNHTANLAGVSKYDSPDPNVPTYETATSYGRQVLNIVYQTDEITNSAPILGSFTSLFIKEDLENANSILHTTEVNNFISTPEAAAAADAGFVTGLTSNINSIITLLETRRLHDWNFFANTKALLNDYMTLKRLEMGGKSNTEFSLINDFIGTDVYKQNLAEQIDEAERYEYDREYVPGTTFGSGSSPPPADDVGPDTETCIIPEKPPRYTYWSSFFGEQPVEPPPTPTTTSPQPTTPKCTSKPVNYTNIITNDAFPVGSFGNYNVSSTHSKLKWSMYVGEILSVKIPKNLRVYNRDIVLMRIPIYWSQSGIMPQGANPEFEWALSECEGDFTSAIYYEKALGSESVLKICFDASVLSQLERNDWVIVNRNKDYYLNIRFISAVDELNRYPANYGSLGIALTTIGRENL